MIKSMKIKFIFWVVSHCLIIGLFKTCIKSCFVAKKLIISVTILSMIIISLQMSYT